MRNAFEEVMAMIADLKRLVDGISDPAIKAQLHEMIVNWMEEAKRLEHEISHPTVTKRGH